jgi:thiol peroxidase
VDTGVFALFFININLKNEEISMAYITFRGEPVSTSGALPSERSKAPDFYLADTDLQDCSLNNFEGKVKILNIVVSLDTSVCARSAKKFDQLVEREDDMAVLTISCDLPFAQEWFCKTERLNNITPLSQMRNKQFGKDYGVEILDGPLAGLLSRAVVVLDRNDTVIYTQQVPEIRQEPDYETALKVARAVL